MKRVLIALAVLAVLALAGGGAFWWFFQRGPSDPYLAILPTGPIDCPADPNDLAGIEGWAPGAGKAQQIGASNAGSISGFAGALGGSSETPSPSATKTCTGLRADVAARFDAVSQRIKLIPTDGYDPAARANLLTDADATFVFVRDRIATEGYAGAMRGASGTLQSHGGSPADKALLLSALLAVHSVPVRYVHVHLTDEELSHAIGAVASLRPAPEDRQLDDAFKQLGVDAATVRADAAALRKRTEDSANATIATARSATDELLGSLAVRSVNLSKDDSTLQARWSTNLRDHWWVQAQINGNWVDFDPTTPDAARGTHLGGLPEGDPVDDLPASVYDTITVRLTADTLTGGTAPKTATLVERTEKVADAYAEPFVVSIGDRSVGSDKIAQASSFTPAIGFKGNETTGAPFKTDGLAVVRLQIETMAGGTVRHVASRVVLDARAANGTTLDPAWSDPKRYAYGLTGEYEILPMPGEIDPALLGLHEAAGMQSLRAFMAYAAAGGNGTQMPPPATEPYPIGALRYFAYDALIRRLLEDASNGAVVFAFDRPQVAIEHRGFVATASALTGVVEFDIADNAMFAAGTDRGAATRANVTRGYADTIAEQQLFSTPNDGGAIALFAAARKAGTALTVLSGDQYGGTALAPAQFVTMNGAQRIGWFSIDPQDGNLLGRMGPSGAGQELAEYAIARANDWSTLYAMIQFYGDFFRCIAGGVEAPLSGLSGAKAQAWFKGCAGAAICSYLEALTVGEAYSRWGTDEEALLYNILDISIPGTKDSWPPSGGAACSALFQSPLYPP